MAKHYHKTASGKIQTCYHQCRTTLADWGFWLGVTITFPIEHFIWEHIPPFSYITKWLGL